jgi:hypothetical protein
MKVFKLSYFLLVLFLISCGRKTLIVEDGFGGLTAIATGKIIMNVSLAWAQSADKFEVIKTCEASGNSLSYHPVVGQPDPEPTPCLVDVPEGRLFYSRIKFDLKKSADDSGCAVIKFFPYYYRKSIAAALEVKTEPPKVENPGGEPVCQIPPQSPAACQEMKDEYGKKLSDYNKYLVDKAQWDAWKIWYDSQPELAKVNCDPQKGPISLSCYGGVGRELDKFPAFKGLSSTAPSIEFKSKDVVRESGDGNRYVTNANIDTFSTPYKFLASQPVGHYTAYCDDIYGNTLAAMKIMIEDLDGDNPNTDHYCSWKTTGDNRWECVKDAPFFLKL